MSASGLIGDWYSVNDEGYGEIDKYALNDVFRNTLKGLNAAIPVQYRWDWSSLHTAVFIERPLNAKEVQAMIDASAADHLVHAHLVVQY